ncbi:MAG: hypothetical protein PUE07_04390 [bacterium]|nr:hypothetical protein [bacterium]
MFKKKDVLSKTSKHFLSEETRQHRNHFQSGKEMTGLLHPLQAIQELNIKKPHP